MDAVGQSFFHSLDGPWLPCIKIQPLWRMYSFDLSKYAVNPWSQNCPINNNDPEAINEKICAWCAYMGRDGISNRVVYVASIVALFGNRTQIPVFVGVTLVRGMEV